MDQHPTADVTELASVPTRADRILQAAGTVFLEKGYDQATTAEIAAGARVSKRDLYKLFESKQGILEALISAHSTALAIRPDLGDPTDLAQMLAILKAFGPIFLMSYFDQRKIGLYRIAITEAPRTNSLGRTLEAVGVGPVLASSTAFITKAVMRGIVAPEDADKIMRTFFDVLIGPWQLRLLMGTHPAPDAATIARQADVAVDVVRRMIIAGKSVDL